MKQLAHRIKRERLRLGWNQTQLAKYLNTTKTTISKWETGYLLPDITQLPILARLFNISTDELLNVTAKLTHEEVQNVVSELLDGLRDSSEQFYSRAQHYFYTYSHDYEFLNTLLGLITSNLQQLKHTDQRNEIFQLGFDIIHIIENNCYSSITLKKTFGYKVVLWHHNEEYNKIIEHLSSCEVNLGENLLLGSAYLASGENDKTQAVLQTDMYQNLSILMQEFLLIITHNLHHLSVERLAKRYGGLNQAFNTDRLFPFLAMPIYEHFANYYATVDLKKAQHYLQRYTWCFEQLVKHFAFQTDDFFNRIGSWFEHFPFGRNLALDYNRTLSQFLDRIIENNQFQRLPNFNDIARRLREISLKKKNSN